MSTNANPFAFRGVSFLTRGGKLKQRYLWQEKLQVCGLSDADLDAFIELFCPDRPYYVTTRRGVDDWFDPHRRLHRNEVVRHLLGDTLTEITPKHVAPKCWGYTRFVGIDVDFHPGEEDDFLRRRRIVRKALRILGVPKGGVRVDDTPSGGKHYRFFLADGIKVEQIPVVLSKVGINQERGRFEIFPCRKTGYRLPFALRPGREHEPTRAGNFIRKYVRGEVPKVSWIECIRRAEAFEAKHGSSSGTQVRGVLSISPALARRSGAAKPKLSSLFCGIPKQERLKNTSAADDCRFNVNCRSKSTLAMDQLFLTGIASGGTRTQATLDLAWHFRFVRRCTASATCETLIEWVYRTGRETSTTVIGDLRKGTRHAEAHTRAIVEWMYRLPEQKRAQVREKGHFSQAEVEYLLTKLKYVPTSDRLELLEFALRCLHFAKRHGACDESGWVAEIAAGEVMRSWPRCSGSSYARKREILTRTGFIQVERGEWRTKTRSGRARTYRLNVQRSLASDATMELPRAMAFASSILNRATENGTTSLSVRNENDSKEKVVKNNLEIQGGVGDPGEESRELILRHIDPPNRMPTHSGANSTKLATTSLRSEYLSLVAANNSLRTPKASRSTPAETTSSHQPAVSSWPVTFLDLPLAPECREWLLRNNGPGMGIPKRYRMMIEAAQRSAAILGPVRDQLAAIEPIRSAGSPTGLVKPKGDLDDARSDALADSGYG